MSEVKGQGHIGQSKFCSNVFAQIGAFSGRNCSLNSRLWTDAQSWAGIEQVPDCFSKGIRPISRSQGQKIADFDQNLAIPDCNSTLNS